jgi:hypothetical protein
MTMALEILDLEVLYVIYPGENSYALHDKVKVVPLTKFLSGE